MNTKDILHNIESAMKDSMERNDKELIAQQFHAWALTLKDYNTELLKEITRLKLAWRYRDSVLKKV